MHFKRLVNKLCALRFKKYQYGCGKSGPLRIIIAGGGTGGHLFPGVAVAEEFMDRDRKNCVLFSGTKNQLEISVLSKTDFFHKKITAGGIKGKKPAQQMAAILKLSKGMMESIIILRKFKPDLVMGMGGYSAAPMILGAWLMGIKIALCEQNLFPGITNRVLSCFADRIYTSFDETRFGTDPARLLFTGNPVRKSILECGENRKDRVEEFSSKRPFIILIIGGSQGAHSINMAITEAASYLKKKHIFRFIHQTGAGDREVVEKKYNHCGVKCRVQPFFNDMDQQYKKADLVICRAGATTVAELTATGKSVIFIPFPYAADNHQELNARFIKEAGACDMIFEKDLSGRKLAEKI
jgi:UDP-N-acetylglucosamine--N-acetylmuramyl-(pentapeptide) pyrophosphoryl-undecaprenol N-acetylglucosamine transferase